MAGWLHSQNCGVWPAALIRLLPTRLPGHQMGFVSTARSLNGTRDDFSRQVHPEVELEAARGDALRSTLRLLSSPPGPTLLGVPTSGE